MKIVHILPTRAKSYGGPVTVAEEIVRELCQQGMHASLFPWVDTDPPKEGWQIPISKESWCKINDAVYDSDIVHIHGLWNFPATAAAFAARRAEIPYVITPHGMLDRWALRKSRLKKDIYGLFFERQNLKLASGIHFLNIEELQEAKEYGISAPYFILPNGVREEQYGGTPHRSLLEEKHPQYQDKILMLFLGRLHPKKGFDLLLPAFSTVADSIPNLHLLIAGPDEGGYQHVLMKLIEQYELTSRVTFLGMVQGKNKAELLGAADFFVLTSHQEGDSMAVKEAMASGLPVIITTSCHFPEITEVKAGLVIHPEIEEVCQALKTMCQLKDERKTMGINAAQLIAQDYTWPTIVGRLQRIYEDITTQKKTSPDWCN